MSFLKLVLRFLKMVLKNKKYFNKFEALKMKVF